MPYQHCAIVVLDGGATDGGTILNSPVLMILTACMACMAEQKYRAVVMQHATNTPPHTRISCTTTRFNLHEKTPQSGVRWAQLHRIQTLEQPPSKPGTVTTVTIQLDTIDTEVPEAHDDSIHPLALYCGVPPHPCWCVPCCKCNRTFF
jgi:hypothetical protein